MLRLVASQRYVFSNALVCLPSAAPMATHLQRNTSQPVTVKQVFKLIITTLFLDLIALLLLKLSLTAYRHKLTSARHAPLKTLKIDCCNKVIFKLDQTQNPTYQNNNTTLLQSHLTQMLAGRADLGNAVNTKHYATCSPDIVVLNSEYNDMIVCI